jgi:hypothetical protein
MLVILSVFQDKMGVDSISRLEQRKFSVQEAVPLIAQMICFLKAKREMVQPDTSAVKYENIRWEIATYWLRLSKDGLTRFIVEDWNQLQDVTATRMEALVVSLLKYAMPSADSSLAKELTQRIFEKEFDLNESDLSDLIFESLQEITFEKLEASLLNVIYPNYSNKLLRRKGNELTVHQQASTGELVQDDFITELFNEGMKVRTLECFFDKYGTKYSQEGKQKPSKVNKEGGVQCSDAGFKLMEEEEEYQLQLQQAEERRLVNLQLNANRIINKGIELRRKKAEGRSLLESSAFPNSKAIPIKAIKNILNSGGGDRSEQSKFIHVLKDKLDRNEDMNFFEFSKEAAKTKIELTNHKNRNKRLNRLKQKIEDAGRTKARSESPNTEVMSDQEPDELPALQRRSKVEPKPKFKAQITRLPDKFVEPTGDVRACACCVLF